MSDYCVHYGPGERILRGGRLGTLPGLDQGRILRRFFSSVYCLDRIYRASLNRGRVFHRGSGIAVLRITGLIIGGSIWVKFNWHFDTPLLIILKKSCHLVNFPCAGIRFN
jgi:hypothetical protein